MALHCGGAESRDGDYFGPTLNRIARLLMTVHGGQIVLSQRYRESLGDAHADQIDVRDLGSHRLRDLPKPEKICQLLHPSLAASFPPLRSLDALPNNLPRQLTSFIGRAKEMGNGEWLLACARLVTLTGTAGTGKSRLAMELAAHNLHGFPDGVWVIDLGTTTRADAVPQVIAATIGVRDEAGRALRQTLLDYLATRRVLLVFENCDRIATDYVDLALAILQQCREVQLIATSREPLAVPGEAILRVEPLPLADPFAPPAKIAARDAVRLFADRDAAAQPAFSLTDHNARALAADLARTRHGIV